MIERLGQMRISLLIVPTAVTCLLATAKLGMAKTDHTSGVLMRITSAAKVCVSGAALPVTVDLENHARLPLSFYQHRRHLAYTFMCRGRYGPHACLLKATLWGKQARGTFLGVFMHGVPVAVIAPGGNVRYCTAVPVGRFLDATMPGRYILRVTTKYGLREQMVTPLVRVNGGALKAGKPMLMLVILQGPGTVPARVGHNVLVSHPLRITIVAPYRKLPAVALGQPALVATRPKSTGLRVVLIKPKAKGSGPITVEAEFVNDGRAAATVRLTGNPSRDFGRVEVTGPSYPGEYTVVKKPKPYDVAYIRKNPAPLTAYGKWLAKHPPKGLKWRTYTLKCGVAYKYAEPINLSCVFDMSVAGVYRVRVELAHTHIWSPWAKVTVSQY